MSILFYQVYFQMPEVLIVRSRELYIRSVECRLPLAINVMVYSIIHHTFINVCIFSHVVPILLLLNALLKIILMCNEATSVKGEAKR